LKKPQVKGAAKLIINKGELMNDKVKRMPYFKGHPFQYAYFV